jgi:hypothetical protein
LVIPHYWADSEALLTRSPLVARIAPALPLDLHVLGTPPAFNLSQDQTLHLNILSLMMNDQRPIAGLFGHSVNEHPKDASTRVPTQVTCQIFKEHPRR